MGKTISVIVAHPDDELITCGRTLFAFAYKGYGVKVLLATDHVLDNIKVSKSCTDIFKHVMQNIPAKYNILNNPAYSLKHTDSQIINFIRDFADGSDIIITHHPDDFNIDHSELSKAVILASRTIKPRMTLFMDSYAPEQIKTFRRNVTFNLKPCFDNIHIPYVELYDLAHDGKSKIRYSDILKERKGMNEYFELYSYRDVL